MKDVGRSSSNRPSGCKFQTFDGNCLNQRRRKNCSYCLEDAPILPLTSRLLSEIPNGILLVSHSPAYSLVLELKASQLLQLLSHLQRSTTLFLFARYLDSQSLKFYKMENTISLICSVSTVQSVTMHSIL